MKSSPVQNLRRNGLRLGERPQGGPRKGSSQTRALPATSLAKLAKLTMLIGFDIGKTEYTASLKCFFVNFFQVTHLRNWPLA